MTKHEELRTVVNAARAKKKESHEFVVMYEEKLARARITYAECERFHFSKQLELEAELKRVGVFGSPATLDWC
jgi:hypothetical protein